MAFHIPVKDKRQEAPQRRRIPELLASAETGLTTTQAEERLVNGYGNISIEPPSKTVGQIVASNVFTYFNLVFFALAACVIAVGSWNDLTFMPVVFANALIGIVQELKAKKTLDKLNILNAPKGIVVRDGQTRPLAVEQAVRDDVVIFSTGSQVFADAIVVSGDCLVNEALMNGEADEIKKTFC